MNNLICSYCEKPLTELSFNGGKWQCRECGKLLIYEEFKKYYEELEKRMEKIK